MKEVIYLFLIISFYLKKTLARTQFLHFLNSVNYSLFLIIYIFFVDIILY